MSQKQKILIISGITGIGKSDFALKIAKMLQTDIIVGDSLQIYKNFPIASNFPNISSQALWPKYHFLGEFDVLKERISAFQYKNMLKTKIDEIINSRKISLIEGGCGFYLYYSLTSSNHYVEQSLLKEAEGKAKMIINENNRDWDKIVNILLQICPNSKDFVPMNDFYRLEKALKYAIASNGIFFCARESNKDETIEDIYDIRGIFLTKNEMNIYQDIHDRCDLMIERGFIEEVNDFCKSLGSFDLENKYQTLPLPLGYKEGAKFIKESEKIMKNETINQEKKNELIRLELLQFCSQFQIKSRQYAHYQVKYARKKFTNFRWINNNATTADNIIKKIIYLLECSREDFEKELKSSENLEYKFSHNFENWFIV